MKRETGKKHKRYLVKDRLKAKRLFLQGYNFYQIAKIISEDTKQPCQSRIVTLWAKKGGWKEEKEKMLVRVNEEVTVAAENDLIKRSEEQRNAYRKMIERGLEELTAGVVQVDKMTEIVQLINTGILGERQINAGLVSWKYIEAVITAISEEVQDEGIRRRIAKRLQGLTTEYLSI